MTKEQVKELLRKKKIWESSEIIGIIEDEKSFFSSDYSEKNTYWREDMKAEDVLPPEMVSDCTFIDEIGSIRNCQMVAIPIFRNNNLNKKFHELNSKSLRNKLREYISGNFSKVNIIIEHRPQTVEHRVVDAVFYTVYGLPSS